MQGLHIVEAYSSCGHTMVSGTYMFSFGVSFDKTQRFISVRADSVYMCAEI